MRMSSSYSFYYVNLITPLCLGVIPLSSLLFFNCAIYRIIKLPSELIHQHVSKRRLTREIDLARILVWIVIIFMVCHSVRLFLDVHEISVIDQVQTCRPTERFPPWIFILLSISKLLIVVNSSINMIIYCCLNARFRKRFVAYKKNVLNNCQSIFNSRTSTDNIDTNNPSNVIEMRSTRSTRKVYI